ncbi:hypothetical protein D3C81_1951770 [compost metagenome]
MNSTIDCDTIKPMPSNEYPTCRKIALPTPNAVQVPARRPWVTASRTTTAKSGPGLATASR